MTPAEAAAALWDLKYLPKRVYLRRAVQILGQVRVPVPPGPAA